MNFAVRDKKSLELVTSKLELSVVAGVLLLGLMSLSVAGSMIAGAVLAVAGFTAFVILAAIRYS